MDYIRYGHCIVIHTYSRALCILPGGAVSIKNYNQIHYESIKIKINYDYFL